MFLTKKDIENGIGMRQLAVCNLLEERKYNNLVGWKITEFKIALFILNFYFFSIVAFVKDSIFLYFCSENSLRAKNNPQPF